MNKNLKSFQALTLLLLSLIGWVERPGEGEQKKAEVVKYMEDALKAEGMSLPPFLSKVFLKFLPNAITMICTWIKTKPGVKALVDNVSGVVHALSMAVTILGGASGETEKTALVSDVKGIVGSAGLALPEWALGVYDTVAPFLLDLAVEELGNGKITPAGELKSGPG